jgi:hypothetical protein
VTPPGCGRDNFTPPCLWRGAISGILKEDLQASGCHRTMSKIFDALRRAESARGKPRHTRTAGTDTPTHPDRRETVGIYIQIPIFVYGYTPRGDPFYEEACTIAINADGGLISMQSVVWAGQQLLVTNKGNEQAQECVVVSVEARIGHSFDVAFQFPVPMPQFWRNVEIGKSAAL